MADDMMRVIRPPHLRIEWIAGAPQRLIQDTSGTALVTYDPATHCGGVYRHEAGMWMLIGPCSLAEFAAGLPALKLSLPDGTDLRQWLDAVGAFDVPAGTTAQ